MTLDQYRSTAKRVADPVVSLFVRLGLTPNQVSVLAVALAGAAGVAFALGGSNSLLYLLGAVFVFCNGALDVLDGELARELGTDSAAGDLLDHVLDRYADILLLVGLAAGSGRYALGLAAVTGVLMTSYLGTQAQAVGLDRVYGGLVGRADRLVIIGLGAAVAAFVTGTIAAGPLGRLGVVGGLLVVFAVVGHLTALQRFYYSYRELA
ncbi:CDP-alcohol phosphatidyltransferase family protein [Haloglomus litoreum]|uniref:CDP-alcohol phosphatidyltransferase family protein n=1 Tax=Haloglomus litoreum TaxID=3034026 RepID=UPI0023E7B5D5|nr:CDP-alcohol phosphatidyltransferase family protein [Haloglomus sp. DT116]